MKQPVKEKVYEAWTAIVDDRVTLHHGNAIVRSSDDTKQYTVRYSGDIYTSDDNATYWQGYPGYPVIAVLMLQGKLPFDREEAEKWKDVNWKAVNTRFKNKYSEAIKFVAGERNIDLEASEKAVDSVMEALRSLPLEIKRKLPDA